MLWTKKAADNTTVKKKEGFCVKNTWALTWYCQCNFITVLWVMWSFWLRSSTAVHTPWDQSTDVIIYLLSCPVLLTWFPSLYQLYRQSPVCCMSHVRVTVSPLNTRPSGWTRTTGLGLSVKWAKNTLSIIQNELFTFSQQYSICWNYFQSAGFNKLLFI